jgi:enterobactin synthetase component D
MPIDRTGPPHFPVAFARDTAHGRLVGVRLPAGDADDIDTLPLHPEELATARALSPIRRIGFVGGRLAARLAAADAGLVIGPLRRDDRGAPMAAGGVAVSISHKSSMAVALVAPAGEWTVGVDLEIPRAPRVDISSRVLTAEEQDAITGLEGDARVAAVLLRFSAKEAIYKAIDPFVRRYVAFDEVQVEPLDGGRMRVVPGPALSCDLIVEASWHDVEGVLLTTARARRRGTGMDSPR